MVETDQIRIDEIQRKLRHRYMLLVGLNIIAYLTVIAFCIVGCNKIGGYSGNSYAFDEYWLYGGLAGLPGIFALLAFAVCIPSADAKKMSKKTQKNIKAAQVVNAALQASVGNVTGAANSISGAMGGTDGFFLGPRARFIAPLFIFGALFLMLGYPPDRIHHDIPEQEEWLLFMLLVLAEIFAIAAAMACRVYNRFKYYHTTDKKEADAEDKRIAALQNERYRIECEKARELKKHKQTYKKIWKKKIFRLNNTTPRYPSLLGQMPGCAVLPYHSFTLGAFGNVSVFAIVRALRFLDCESRCA